MNTKKSSSEHEHSFTMQKKVVGVYSKQGIRARDTLQLWVCDCGKSEAFDLTRKLVWQTA